MKKYNELKTSNIEWLEEIPIHWKALPCRAIVSNRTDKNENADITNYLSLMANVGVIRYEDKGDIGNKKPEDLSKCKIVKKNNLVINSMNYSIGSYGISTYDGVCSPVYIVLEPVIDAVEVRFAFRIFECKPLQRHLAMLGNGILAHRAAIKWDDIKPQCVPVPPKYEQRAILKYLDRETTRIDSLIQEKQVFIDLLKEQRQALISHVATKGLDPDVEMRRYFTGSAQCTFPSSWKRSRLKFHVTNIIDTEHRTIPFVNESDYHVVRTSDIREGKLLLDACKRTDISSFSQWTRRGKPKPGDVILTREAPAGEACIVPSGFNICLGQRTVLIKTKNDLNPEFLLLSLYSDLTKCFIDDASNGSTVKHVNMSDIPRIPLLLPGLREQRKIVAHAKKETGRIDRLTILTKNSIELLKEYRTALITAAVTGQIDIRDQ